MESNTIKLQPVMTEKTYAMANAQNKYTFMVPRGINNIEIGKAVQIKYKVKVIDVNRTVKYGKIRRDYRTYKMRREPDMVKVIVTLKKGDKIDEFLKA
ncbi:50S ribosomal protein L23 [bacterium]|nr:50S ribosomal protein L23 [bacterium]